MNKDYNKQREARLRLRRERRSGTRQAAAEAAAASEEQLPQTPRRHTAACIAPQEPLSAPLEAVWEAALTPATPEHATATRAPQPKKEPQKNPAKGVRRALALCHRRSLAELREQADAGEAAAQYTLAAQYRANGYEEVSYLPYLQAAAATGFLPAVGLYGALLSLRNDRATGEPMAEHAAHYGFGEGAFLLYEQAAQNGDAAAARRWLVTAGKTPYLPALRALANCYGRGILFPADEELAAEWLKRAADAGDAEAALLYARAILAYKLKHREKYPYKEAMRYYRKATEAGNDEALFELAELCCRLYRQDDKYITREAYLKICYQERAEYDYLGWISLEKQAVALYLRAAAKSAALRRRVLDTLRTRTHDVRRAVLKPLAEQGDAEALYLLGYFWENAGSYCSAYDKRETATHYYRRAAAAGYGPALAALHRLHRD